MQWPDTVLDALQDHTILNAANSEAVAIYTVRRDKNQALVDPVLKRGTKPRRCSIRPSANQSHSYCRSWKTIQSGTRFVVHIIVSVSIKGDHVV